MADGTEAEVGTTQPPARRRDHDTQATARATLMLAQAFAEHLRGDRSTLVASIGAARDLLDELLNGTTVDRGVRYLILTRVANCAAYRAQYAADEVITKSLSCWELVDEMDVPALVASVTLAWAQINRLKLV